MRRVRLELRRARGWLAFQFIQWWPGSPFVLRSIPLGWAGLYAHCDYDRANWADWNGAPM